MTMQVTKRSGELEPMDQAKYSRQIDWACDGLKGVSADELKAVIKLSFYDGITTAELNKAIIIAAAGLISIEAPNWTYVAARMVMQEARKQVTGGGIEYPTLANYMATNIAAAALDPRLAEPTMFDHAALEAEIDPTRDLDFDYQGAQIVVDRYLNRDPITKKLIELPQHWRMRVAMGIAQDEITIENRTKRALEYYHTYGKGEASPSTPTQFNAGTLRPQLSSCFGTMIPDDTDGIMQAMTINANFSKNAGGCSASFTHIRSNGSLIASTGGGAGGPIPYAKIFQDTLNGFDQSGKRKGAGVGYLAPWHADFEDWLKLHDPGDERQRTRDMFVASWIPDIFMERVGRHEMWSMFDPKDTPMLLQTHGPVFTEWYNRYEAEGLAKKTIDAEALWREIITKWVQQSVGWPCFSDEINHRYAQQEMVHQSNLCTEICLRNDEKTSFVCNLTSVNLSKIKFDYNRVTKRLAWNETMERIVRTCVRSLDSVISVGWTPHESGRRFQMSDRAVGLGVMGGVEALYRHGIDYESEDAVHFSNEVFKQISAVAIHESHLLSIERGVYPKFTESTWAQGKLPIDSVRRTRVIEKFGLHLDLVGCHFAPEGWDTLRGMVRNGMRNSTLMAIAPTATIALILNTTECWQPPEDLLVIKENMSSDFKVISPIVTHNPYGLEVRNAFDLDHMWTIWSNAARQLWIDQAQSMNIWVDPLNFKPRRGIDKWADYLDEVLFESWRCGNKTTYYLHSKSMAETPTAVGVNQPGPAQEYDPENDPNYGGGRVCSIDAGPDCEACQ